jgi:NADH-quinone oxidoreductase subunit L
VFLAFFGGPRMSKEVAHHIHESPPVMTVPLVVLAVLTIAAGWVVGIPSEHGTRFARFLEPVFPIHESAQGGLTGAMLLALSVVIVFAGISLAWYLYMTGPVRPERIGQPRTPLHAFLLNAWYIDWLYDRAIVRPLVTLYGVFARFDLRVIDGLVNMIGLAVVAWSAASRRVQTGYVVNYALTMLAGAVAVVAFLLAR